MDTVLHMWGDMTTCTFICSAPTILIQYHTALRSSCAHDHHQRHYHHPFQEEGPEWEVMHPKGKDKDAEREM